MLLQLTVLLCLASCLGLSVKAGASNQNADGHTPDSLALFEAWKATLPEWIDTESPLPRHYFPDIDDTEDTASTQTRPRAAHDSSTDAGNSTQMRRGLRLNPAGPCSREVAATLEVGSPEDFRQRLGYGNTSTVLILVTRHVILSSSLILNASFSCTIIRPHPQLLTSPWIWLTRNDAPAVRIERATNVFIAGISIGFMSDAFFMTPCMGLPEFYSRFICPSLFVYRVWNLILTQGTVVGRTDLFGVGGSRVEFMRMWSTYRNDSNSFQGWSTLRIMATGDARTLTRSGLVISNNDISGSWTSVLMYWGAVGVTVSNNNIHDFFFGGIQCGQSQINVADCMLSSIHHNFISGQSLYGDIDGAGIYFDTHWYNPGNILSCNYIARVPHCYYLDYTSSGILIDSGVCLFTTDGIKVNTGTGNQISSVVVVQPFSSGAYISCQNWCINNCLTSAEGYGSTWNAVFEAKYNTAGWAASWPYLANFCNATSYMGISCNPSTKLPPSVASTNCGTFLPQDSSGTPYTPGPEATGKCSGIPALNKIQVIVVNGTAKRTWKAWVPFFECASTPVAEKLNSLQAQNYPPGQLQFDSPKDSDYGVSDPASNVYALFPDFKSCPLWAVGIRKGGRPGVPGFVRKLREFNSVPHEWWVLKSKQKVHFLRWT